MRAVSIAAATIRSGSSTARYRRKACAVWNMESEERAFLATHPPDNRHAEPQAAGGRDKKRWHFENPVGQHLQTRLRGTRNLRLLPDALPNGWTFSGASIAAMRTLCFTLLESRTVVVSPSAILTTAPSRMLAAEREDGIEMKRIGGARTAGKGVIEADPSATPPSELWTLRGETGKTGKHGNGVTWIIFYTSIAFPYILRKAYITTTDLSSQPSSLRGKGTYDVSNRSQGGSLFSINRFTAQVHSTRPTSPRLSSTVHPPKGPTTHVWFREATGNPSDDLSTERRKGICFKGGSKKRSWWRCFRWRHWF